MGQQLNTIPIQYYFIEDGRRIQDRNGIDSEMTENAVVLPWIYRRYKRNLPKRARIGNKENGASVLWHRPPDQSSPKGK
jgi:hypothetical protein